MSVLQLYIFLLWTKVFSAISKETKMLYFNDHIFYWVFFGGGNTFPVITQTSSLMFVMSISSTSNIYTSWKASSNGTVDSCFNDQGYPRHNLPVARQMLFQSRHRRSWKQIYAKTILRLLCKTIHKCFLCPYKRQSLLICFIAFKFSRITVNSRCR